MQYLTGYAVVRPEMQVTFIEAPITPAERLQMAFWLVVRVAKAVTVLVAASIAVVAIATAVVALHLPPVDALFLSAPVGVMAFALWSVWARG